MITMPAHRAAPGGASADAGQLPWRPEKPRSRQTADTANRRLDCVDCDPLAIFQVSSAAPGSCSPFTPFSCWRGWSRAMRCRSEEHTSELQSLMRNSYAVFCLKKKTTKTKKKKTRICNKTTNNTNHYNNTLRI